MKSREFSQFTDRDEFVTLARFHFSRQIQHWAAKSSTEVVHYTPATTHVPVPIANNPVEEGLLGLYEIANKSLSEALESVQLITSLYSENATRTELNLKHLEAVALAPDDRSNMLVKQILGIVSTDLSFLTKGMREQSERFTAKFAISMEAISKAFAYQEFRETFCDKDRAQLFEVISEISEKIPTMDQSMKELSNTIGVLPRWTTTLNHSKNNAITEINTARESLLRARRLVADLIQHDFFKH